MKTNQILITGSHGYIGSALREYFDKSTGINYSTCDAKLDGMYQDLGKKTIREYDVIIHLAGHSSVSSCDDDPIGSLHNNCVDFFRFANKVSKHQKLIYASSASVYGNSPDKYWKEEEELPSPLKEYDRQKQMIDYYMLQSNKKFYGLRFGTVCGASPVMRSELLINSMTRDAILNRSVNITNAGNNRSVLGMKDLVRAIETIIKKDVDPGIYNLASFSGTIGNIGYQIGMKFPSTIVASSSHPMRKKVGYSFQVSTSKFQRASGFEFRETIDSIAESVAKTIKAERDKFITYTTGSNDASQ